MAGNNHKVILRPATPLVTAGFLVAVLGIVGLLCWLVGWWPLLLCITLFYVSKYIYESIARSRYYSVTTTIHTWALRGLVVTLWILTTATAEEWYWRLLLAGSIIPFMVSLLQRSQACDEFHTAQMRNQRAQNIYHALRESSDANHEAYCFYLRPFASERKLLSEIPASVNPIGAHHLDFETMLCRALQGSCSLFCLGDQDDALDLATRIKVPNSQWQDAVSILARGAEFIVIVPLPYQGTIWEFEWLKANGLLHKTLCVMPESTSIPLSGCLTTGSGDKPAKGNEVMEGLDYSAITMELISEWTGSTEIAEQKGIRLPVLASSGALFVIDPQTGGPKHILPLALTVLIRRKRWLRAALTHVGLITRRQDLRSVPMLIRDSCAWYHSSAQWALVVSTDSFVIWGKVDQAIECFTLAREAGEPRCELVQRYLESIPILAFERERALGVRLFGYYEQFRMQLLETNQRWEVHPGLRVVCTGALMGEGDRGMAMNILGAAFNLYRDRQDGT